MSPASDVDWRFGAFFSSVDPLNTSKVVKSFLVLDAEPNFFQEPFDSFWFSILVALVYVVHLAQTVVILAFVSYEIQGLAGPYRTVINQLLSCIYLFIVVYVTITPVGVSVLRVWFGPLPKWICSLTVFSNNVIWMSGTMIFVAIVVLKFIFVCIWKNLKPMNDNLVSSIVVTNALLLSVVFAFVKIYLPGKPGVFDVVCTGIYHLSDDFLPPKFPVDIVFASICFIFYLSMYIPTIVKRRKIEMENFTQPLNINNTTPKSLESLALNLMVVGLIVAVTLLTGLMNR